MNGFQNVIKIFAICLAVFIIVNIFGWTIFGLSFLVHIGDYRDMGEFGTSIDAKDGVSIKEGFSETYENANRIDIDLAYSRLYIKTGSELKVEARRNKE